MRRVFRAGDVLMRLGGDEFVFFAPGTFERPTPERISERLFGQISAIQVPPMTEHIMVSLGITLCREGDTFDTLYQRSDRGVYTAKHSKGCSFTLD